MNTYKPIDLVKFVRESMCKLPHLGLHVLGELHPRPCGLGMDKEFSTRGAELNVRVNKQAREVG